MNIALVTWANTGLPSEILPPKKWGGASLSATSVVLALWENRNAQIIMPIPDGDSGDVMYDASGHEAKQILAALWRW